MRINRRKIKFYRRKINYILSLSILFMLFTIGYAFLTTSVSINGTGYINRAEWNVRFSNIQTKAGSVTPTTIPTISDNTSVAFAATLENPGDFYEFTIDVVNSGTIPAMIDTVSVLPTLTTEQANYFSYSVTYSDGAEVISKQLLDAGDTETLKVSFQYLELADNTLYPIQDQNFQFNLSIDYVQADDTAIDVPHPLPKCIRATTLHTETCTNSYTSYYCQGAGYALNSTITYGNQTTTEGVLTTGDAFDCDVNGDGTYDASTERFYYVSDYYDTSTTSFNNNVAVLIYYSNVRGGVANTLGTAYDSSGENWHGPVTARSELPTKSQWSNVSLYKETRPILAENNATATSGGTLPTEFSYTGYAARLLTYQEAYQGCNSYSENNKYPTSTGGLDSKCQFLMEGTKFVNNSLATYGPWLESPIASYSLNAYYVSASYRYLYSSSAYYTDRGARPTIEILKSEISY